MVRTPSVMVPLGSPAAPFALPDPNGNVVRLDDLDTSNGLLVMFICNHCPYVQHVADDLAKATREFLDESIAVVGISSNDVEQYPEDGPEAMGREAKRRGYAFPYLYDESQDVAKAYQAACTPDLYVFDASLACVYHGQFDDSRPNSGRGATGRDLRHALDAVIDGQPVSPDQKPSVGCNIKWKS